MKNKRVVLFKAPIMKSFLSPESSSFILSYLLVPIANTESIVVIISFSSFLFSLFTWLARKGPKKKKTEFFFSHQFVS